MKYKNIKSFAHNFTHSFVSYENRIDDRIVMEELSEIARGLTGEYLIICWLPENCPINTSFSPSVIKSIAQYRKWLPEHASHHDIDLSCIRELRTEIYRKLNHQLAVESVAVDDRGKEYRCAVDF